MGDHPRLRGENIARSGAESRRTGSPPPTRGKHATRHCQSGCMRITPAYAGKTRAVYSAGLSWRDHPRLRGENQKRHYERVRDEGSPPPTRGKLNRVGISSTSARITPAYAGKTAFYGAGYRENQDHPRLRGENFDWISEKVSGIGSPPPTRGKRGRRRGGGTLDRITPAYAGKTNCVLYWAGYG